MENIIFGLMVVIIISAGLLTCIYEAGGSARTTTNELPNTENTEQCSEQNE